MMRILHILLALIFVLKLTLGLSQLVTASGQAPQGLVQNVLIGPGVTVSNILYNGSPTAIGSFTATGTNLGISQGIVMTTGTIMNNGAGPQGPNNAASSGTDNNMPGSGILSGIIQGTQTYNAATLEFDFIPYADTIRFKYVFGSEEYPEFAPPNNSTYNDVFGFFISGPGITGLQNIAQLPNGGGVVSINNVNAVTNSLYYNANGDGTMAPYNTSPNYIQYDGFTDVLEAVSAVQCGQTYHLILAISDVGDGSWDSGIFLEANSLSSKTPVDVSSSISQQVFPNPDWMAEGCVSATVTVTRQNNINSPLSIPLTVSGSATQGVDYTGIPNAVNFSPGQAIYTFQINVNADNFAEGLETIVLNFNVADPCGNVTPIPLTLYIQDVPPLTLNLNDTTLLCPNQPISLTAVISGGVQPYTYLWSTGATTAAISFTAQSSQTIYVQVTDNCTGLTLTDSALVSVPVFPPLSISLSPDVTEICPYLSHTFYSTVNGGNGNYTYTWRTLGSNSVLSTSDSLNVTPSSTNSYVFTVTDGCGNIARDTVTYTITSPPLLLSMTPTQYICPGDSAFVSVIASGGYGNHYYLWPSNGATTPGIWVYPGSTNSYQVLVSDECQSFNVSGFSQVQIVKPVADFTILTTNPTENLPTSFYNLTQNGFGYQWFFGDGSGSYEIHPTHTFSPYGEYLITLIATDMNGCVDSITKPIYIQEEFYIYIPNSFIPDENRINEVFSGSFVGVEWINIEVFNRWGERLFFSDQLDFKWDGTYNGAKVPDGVYTWKLIYRRNRMQEQQLTGHVTVIK
jgi:gliding motility-associated-like protein